jgi:hypothetical protein
MKVTFNKRVGRALFVAAGAAPLVLATSCGGDGASSGSAPTTGDGGASTSLEPQTLQLDVTAVDTTFVTREHFIASVEMQVSGEPFAEAMGRSLAGFSRDFACRAAVCQPNTYYDPALNDGVVGGKRGRADLAGFSSAVESYEYSKQPMNNIAFESGAGTSLAFGSVLNPTGKTGVDALQLLHDWVQKIAAQANTGARIDMTDGPNNPLGWPGFWPTVQPFTSWSPAIKATSAATGCTISSDDDPGASGALQCDDYECDYTTLHLADRAAQVNTTVGPGASGWAGWKEALWVLNYLQVMHDANEAPVKTVPPDQLALVGVAGNTVVGNGPNGATAPGTFLGSSNIEGFQAGNFLAMLDNQAQDWLTKLTTADGATLGGFSSVADALAYTDESPLRWFPSAIKVSETADASGFPRPSGYAIGSPDSNLLDLAGLLGAYASVYALTDQSNAQVGGSQPALAYFDGDPFPVQNQTPTGAPTLHDRALAMMRVIVVNMDRLHADPTTGLLVDDVKLAGGSPSRGRTLSIPDATYALLSLRTARRSVESLLTLYSNTKPDPRGVPCPLDAFGAIRGVSFGARLDAMIDSLASVFYDRLTTADGRAYGGWDVTKGTPTDDGNSLDAHSGAIRGLLVAHLATGQTKYRERAKSVFERLEHAFYDRSARAYRPTPGDTSSTLTFTPLRFAMLQAALREVYELIGLLPGNDALASLVEQRFARLNKLVLNGWDDRDQDELVTWPAECAHLGKQSDGQPMGLGGLQMGERVLSGESGSATDTWGGDAGPRQVVVDREHDCVPEISAVGLPAALASSITFTLTPYRQP